MSSAIFDMEMQRLDAEIDKTRRQFYSAVLGKKRRVKRTWLEINTLTNAHLLQTLPYRAMLGHVAKVAGDRDKVIREILAAKESSQQDEANDSDEGHVVEISESNECPGTFVSESDFTPITSTGEADGKQLTNEKKSGESTILSNEHLNQGMGSEVFVN
ncbi:hypothetical protein Ocin01_03466 [Orchesella cincta]|uniref:Uncharacterized protein n=1 Tax=Orchesella cincta TaxID=48709 RepID=A0A1D2NDA5_ORCCI|nr:hypothetical protein Ocin01_03466 [Orchesella cincta]